MEKIHGLNKNTRYYNPPAGTEETYAEWVIDLDSQP